MKKPKIKKSSSNPADYAELMNVFNEGKIPIFSKDENENWMKEKGKISGKVVDFIKYENNILIQQKKPNQKPIKIDLPPLEKRFLTEFSFSRLETFKEFLTIVPDFNKTYSYRGQANSNWELQTLLERRGDISGRHLSMSIVEENLLNRFKRNALNYKPPVELPEESKNAEWLSIIQHYGGPTRLLDFTKSFSIALFFAFERKMNLKSRAVWCFHNVLVNSSNPEITLKYQNSEEYIDACLQNEIIKDHIRFVDPFIKNERIDKQQGIFLCPSRVSLSFESVLYRCFNLNKNRIIARKFKYRGNNKKELKDIFDTGVLIKIIIPDDFRDYISEYLKTNYITHTQLFPDFEGLIKSLYTDE